MTDSVRARRQADQALASQAQGLGPSGFDPSRRSLNDLSREELVHECCYRGAELVIERRRNDLSAKRLKKSLERAWTDFLDANPDDLTGIEEYPDHALITFEQLVWVIENAIAMEARQGRDAKQGPVEDDSAGPQDIAQ